MSFSNGVVSIGCIWSRSVAYGSFCTCIYSVVRLTVSPPTSITLPF